MEQLTGARGEAYTHVQAIVHNTQIEDLEGFALRVGLSVSPLTMALAFLLAS